MEVRELDPQPRHPKAFQELVEALGESWVSAQPIDRTSYSFDVWPIVAYQVHKGQVPYPPDLIVWPKNEDEIARVIDIARKHVLPIVPYAGGSGCVGGIVPVKGGITLDVKRMDKILSLDREALTVTVEAGILLQTLEDSLQAEGYTLGHFPQSMHSAAVGGTVAHNGIGTFSTKYGKFDDMVLGMNVVLPNGRIVKINPTPKRSTGPNLNELFLGSEGTLGIVSQVTLKIHHAPQKRIFQAFAVPNMRLGLDLARLVIQHDIKPAVVRLYDKIEGKGLLFETLEIEDDVCLLLFIYEGFEELIDLEAKTGKEICVNNGGKDLGPDPAVYWYEKKRFDVRHYLSKTKGPSQIADTLEIAATWDKLADLYYAVRDAMEQYPCRSMGHSSHIYPQGANLYMIFFADVGSEEWEDVEKVYSQILNATFETCRKNGGTISHHHGIGMAKKQWMTLEHGSTGMEVLRKVKNTLDPDNIMNPGKLGLGE